MFAEVAQMMSDEKFDKTEFNELKKEIGSAMDGTHENSAQIKTMMQTLMSGGAMAGMGRQSNGMDIGAIMQSFSGIDMASLMKNSETKR